MPRPALAKSAAALIYEAILNERPITLEADDAKDIANAVLQALENAGYAIVPQSIAERGAVKALGRV